MGFKKKEATFFKAASFFKGMCDLLKVISLKNHLKVDLSHYMLGK